MGSEWALSTLGAIASKVKNGLVDGPFGSNLPASSYTKDGLPVIRGSNLTLGLDRFVDSAFVFVSEDTANRLSRSLCGPNDIVFTKKGTIGQTGIIPEGKFEKYLISSNQMKLTVDSTIADPLFVYYYVSSKASVDKILRDSEATGVPKINLQYIKNFPIRLPSLEVQKSIATILGSFDDKIALNHQTNTTLESMAQALFKSWFVDFDPVIDNALAAGNPIPEPLQARADARAALGDQRKPLPDHIRQQFPDRFVLTEEMGWVPEGWEVTPLSEAIEINPKVTIKKGQKAKHVDMKALPTSGYCVGEVSEKEYAGGAKFERGDVLLARITPCLENGKTGVVDFLTDGEPGFGSTEFIVMRPKNAIGTSFVAALARQEAFRQHCISNMVGSSGRQRVQNSCFDTYFICTPKVPDILDLYRDNCEAWFEKMTTLANESRSLGMLRDTLLPKLLSSELRIPEAEQQVEEVI